MALNNLDHAQNIYRRALERFALTYTSIDDTQKDQLYRETISILDYLIADLSYTTHMVKYGEYPGNLNGLTFVLDVAWWLRGDVWHRFLKVGNGNYKADYLSSEAWRTKREQVMWRDGHQCPCGAEATEVHHKHYNNIGKEQLEDLVALCRTCHEKCENASSGE